ncbi:hypothetical protein RD792_008788 [Penstemon davidsonii]|uniref:C2 domain-containing protein n=1 Tax=Penstemon davidsonii TaxID=160366 RepID=A0ABR0DA23_9LAMI|nr:hypothetical protein RD792_008788 [Penstemon davidsonii]
MDTPNTSNSHDHSKLESSTKSLMDNQLGLLRIRVKRGINLAVRDVRSSDPYVVVKMGKQVLFFTIFFLLFRCGFWHFCFFALMLVRLCFILENENERKTKHNVTLIDKFSLQRLKTRVIRKDTNPEWNEDLTLSISDHDEPIFLTVYDHDTFSMDDKMGEAEFDVRPFIGALKMNLKGLPNGTVITKIQPSRSNCLAEESSVILKDGKLVQDMRLRLKNVECGEVELQLQWIDLHGSKVL